MDNTNSNANNKKKLNLNTQTLRELTGSELEYVAGGTNFGITVKAVQASIATCQKVFNMITVGTRAAVQTAQPSVSSASCGAGTSS